jgi:hypothetical protein
VVHISKTFDHHLEMLSDIYKVSLNITLVQKDEVSFEIVYKIDDENQHQWPILLNDPATFPKEYLHFNQQCIRYITWAIHHYITKDVPK